jgi:uncharacterized protein
MRKKIKEIGLLVLGWFFVGLGIVGLFLPILQGFLFILIGLSILSTRSELIKRLLSRIEERYPKQFHEMEAWKEKMKNRLRRSKE